MQFHPKKFWRSADWTRSSTKPYDGWICEELLYAGEFGDVAVHLLPNIQRVMIPLTKKNLSKMLGWDIAHGETASSLIFTETCNQKKIEEFTPTVYTFNAADFSVVESGEYVSDHPQTAVDQNTYSMSEAIKLWQFEIIYVDKLSEILDKIGELQLEFSHQD
jgi:hypothetical protein